MDRPPPLRTDGSNEFARLSMAVRIPRIARDVAVGGDVGASARSRLERLAGSIEANAPLPGPVGPAPDLAAWNDAHAAHGGETWLGTEWFYAELAFYFALASACRFWETDRDPFGAVKDEELAGARPWERLEGALSAARPREERIHGLLEAALWGNRVDLSYTVAAARTQTEGDLLVDDRRAALPWLAAPGCDLHLVADNTGAELALDLALVACVLEDPSARATVHLKAHPVFVSDALVRDVWRLLERMRARGGDAERLSRTIESHFEAGRLTLAPDPFWSGPRFLWHAPPHLGRALAAASGIVVKGDANYRRVIGDALWAPATPLSRACDYLPVPVVCLRTMKSDPVLGLPAGLAEKLDATEPRWRIDGRRGLIQAATPP
jgi:hypothetical protein